MSNLDALLKVSLPGPWVLDADALNELDEITEEKWKTWRGENKKRIRKIATTEVKGGLYKYRNHDGADEETCIKREINNLRKLSSNQEKRELSVVFASGKETKVKSFADLIHDKQFSQEIATRFTLDMRCGDHRCQIEYLPWGDELKIDISPSHLTSAKDLFARIETWAASNQAGKWGRRWTRAYTMPDIALTFLMLIGITFISAFAASLFSSSNNNARHLAAQQARELLDEGINASNQHRATAIALSHQINYYPGMPPQTGLPTWWYAMLIAPYIIFLLLLMPPVTVFAVTKAGETKLRWRATLARHRSKLLFSAVGLIVAVAVIEPAKDYLRGVRTTITR